MIAKQGGSFEELEDNYGQKRNRSRKMIRNGNIKQNKNKIGDKC